MSQQEKSVTLGEIAKGNFTTVSEASSFFEVLSAVCSTNLPFTLVVDTLDHTTAHDVKGVITSQQLVESMVENIELFSD